MIQMNRFLVNIKKADGQIRKQVVTTDKRAIQKHTLKKLLSIGEQIDSVEYFNPIDDIDVLTGNKHIIVFMDVVVFASESILIGDKDVIGGIRCLDIKNLVRKAQNEFYDTSKNITVRILEKGVA